MALYTTSNQQGRQACSRHQFVWADDCFHPGQPHQRAAGGRAAALSPSRRTDHIEKQLAKRSAPKSWSRSARAIFSAGSASAPPAPRTGASVTCCFQANAAREPVCFIVALVTWDVLDFFDRAIQLLVFSPSLFTWCMLSSLD